MKHHCKYKNYIQYIKKTHGKLFPSFTSTKWPDGTVSKVVWMFSARDIMITERTPELAITQHMKSFKIFNLDKKHEKIKNNP